MKNRNKRGSSPEKKPPVRRKTGGMHLLKMDDFVKLAHRNGVLITREKLQYYYARLRILPRPIYRDGHVAYYPYEFLDAVMLVWCMNEFLHIPLRYVRKYLRGYAGNLNLLLKAVRTALINSYDMTLLYETSRRKLISPDLLLPWLIQKKIADLLLWNAKEDFGETFNGYQTELCRRLQTYERNLDDPVFRSLWAMDWYAPVPIPLTDRAFERNTALLLNLVSQAVRRKKRARKRKANPNLPSRSSLGREFPFSEGGVAHKAAG